MSNIFFDILGMIFVWVLILVVPILVIYCIALWQLFQKAGRNGWEAIIPFYNTWVLAEISGIAWWYPLIIIFTNLGIVGEGMISAIASLASIIANFFICYNLSKKFHKGIDFAILMTLFPWVIIPIIAFSSNYQYDKEVIVNENGPIDDSIYDRNKNNNYSIKRYCQYCGNKFNNEDKFCSNCGNEIKRSFNY